MDAAHDHLETAAEAQGETQTLGGAINGFGALVEATVGAVGHAVDELAVKIRAFIEQLATVKTAADQSVVKGNEHVGAAVRAGHGTKAYAEVALEKCESASAKLAGLDDMLEGMAKALEDAKDKAIAALLGASESKEDITEGLKAADELLGEAIANINATIHS
jgi:hypothetical protein